MKFIEHFLMKSPLIIDSLQTASWPFSQLDGLDGPYSDEATANSRQVLRYAQYSAFLVFNELI
ncbi:hypothetical protein I7I50_05747 [Histoplasma capsulatum G186AR]|uniref:Uncharacterized protein n=1 Tax=Ajellomyces capsulatus TaxID=5037 RepID=A0A8H8D8C6_AJECA|nr:hypothetical protein I7I52_04007 [Histoplasma capsulatum]QSS76332.1 hypothetical protein I7I50_05747 [Histoplasma capsulatum G186AR]